MNETLEIMHKTQILTYADCYTLLFGGVFIGVFISNGIYAIIDMIIKRIKRSNKHE